MVSGTTAYCGGCHGHWNLCNDVTFTPKQKKQEQNYANDWTEDQWGKDQSWKQNRTSQSPRRRAKSPRHRSSSARHRTNYDAPEGAHKGPVEKGSGKGKAKDKGGAVAFGHLPPSTQWLAPPPPPFPTESATTTLQPTPMQSAAMQPFGKSRAELDKEAELQALRQLHAQLRGHSGEQSEDVRKALAAVEASVRKEDAKSYKQLVSQLDRARKQLSDIEEQWEAFRFQWTSYLDNATKMWTAHIESYEEGENKFAVKRREAAVHLQQVRQQLHEIHVRTMAVEGTVPNVELEEGQTALDATMSIEDVETVTDTNQFTELKTDLQGVVQRVKDTIEQKITKRSLAARAGDGDDVQLIEPADKKTREST